jgi:hypothetical protein
MKNKEAKMMKTNKINIINKFNLCNCCGGKGYIVTHQCYKCNGSGRKWFFFDCDQCFGSGYIPEHKCFKCNGSGMTKHILPIFKPSQVSKPLPKSTKLYPDYSKFPPPWDRNANGIPDWRERGYGGMDGNPNTPF